MLEELAALVRISLIDTKALRVETELREIPERMTELEGDVGRLGELLEAELQEVREAEKLLAQQESEMSSQTQSLARSKAKGARATNMREHDAVERELETIRRSLKEREEEREKLVAAIATRKQSLEKYEKEFADLKAFADKERETADARLGVLNGQLKEALTGRDEWVPKVTGAVLRRYDMIRSRRGGLGACFIKSGSCAGCFVAISPQQAIRVQRAESLEQCPNCQRFLFDRATVEALGGAVEEPSSGDEPPAADAEGESDAGDPPTDATQS